MEGVYAGPTGHGPGGASGTRKSGRGGLRHSLGAGAGAAPLRGARGGHTPWGMYIRPARPYIPPAEAGLGARPEEGARRAGGQGAVRHRAERASQPSAHAPLRRHDSSYTSHTKNALATPEGVEGDASQKLPPRAEKCSVHYTFSVDSPLRPRSPVEILGWEGLSPCSCG